MKSSQSDNKAILVIIVTKMQSTLGESTVTVTVL